VTPAAATAAARRAVAAPARPARRVSGPARPAPGRPVRRPARPVAVPRSRRQADLPLGARALEWLRGLPDHRLLDRLIGGRVWIVLLGTLLVGIVTMQLSLLRMNAGIGRAVERSTQLEQSNAALRLSISELSDTDRIVSEATGMGFVMPPQGSPRFLTASAADADKALTTMRVPDPNAAAEAAAQLAASAPVAPVTAGDPAAATTAPATSDPSAATTAPATGTGATTPATAGTTAPATSTAAPAADATAPATASTPVAAGGASVLVQPQG